MRLAFIGASHWHLPLYLDPALDLAGVTVAGVSDPSAEIVAALSARLACAGDTDYRALCERIRPDFVIALGRHADMAAQARFLIDARIPFALEKPCGLNLAEVSDIAARAEAAGVFAAVPLVIRNGAFADLLHRHARPAGVQSMSWRFIAGFPARYRAAGCAWMLDPALAGGGCAMNLAPHFIDLALTLLGPETRLHHASMSNAAWGEAVEDYAAITLERDGALCLVETGYLYPGPTSTFDMHFAVRTPAHYIIAHDPDTVETITPAGTSTTHRIGTTNVPQYRTFVADVLARAATSRAPLASLADMVPVMRLLEQAYRSAGPLRARPDTPHGL